MRAWAIVVAAGRGERFGDPHGLPKVLRRLGDLPVYLHAVRAFDEHPRVEGTVLVFPAIWEGQILEELPGRVKGPVRLVAGGATRSASVRAGLGELPPDAEVVLVHDAARPLVTEALIDRVLEAVAGSPAAVCAVPVADTLKRVRDGAVTETVARADLVMVQTPQGFRVDILRAAHADPDADATDDAALVEAAGHAVAVVAGDERNVKITTPADLELAEALLRMEGER